MVPVRLIRAHARGRVSCQISLTIREKFVAPWFPGCNLKDKSRGSECFASRHKRNYFPPGSQVKRIRPLFDTLEIADRKSTRLNSSHVKISYAVFCLKKKKHRLSTQTTATSTRSSGP